MRWGNHSADTSHELYLIIHTHTPTDRPTDRATERETWKRRTPLKYKNVQWMWRVCKEKLCVCVFPPHFRQLCNPAPPPLSCGALLYFTPSWHTFVVTTINAKCHIVHIVNINLSLVCVSPRACAAWHFPSLFSLLYYYYSLPVYCTVLYCIRCVSLSLVRSPFDLRLVFLYWITQRYSTTTTADAVHVFTHRFFSLSRSLVALLSRSAVVSLLLFNMYMYVILKTPSGEKRCTWRSFF